MKKILLVLVYVFATGTTFMNANSSKKEVIKLSTTKTMEVFDEFSCIIGFNRDDKARVSAFVDNIETTVTEENVFSLNEISETELIEEILKLNNSSEDIVSLKCCLAKQWIKRELRKISDQDELIDEIGDAVYAICEVARDLGWID